MIATLQPTPLDMWRRHFGGNGRRLNHSRPLAALGYMANGPVAEGLIEIEKLTLVILYDEQLRAGNSALRLAGYTGSRVPWGVRFGGPENCRFFKDLAPSARGTANGQAGTATGRAQGAQSSRPDEPDFSKMTQAEKIAWNLERWRRIVG